YDKGCFRRGPARFLSMNDRSKKAISSSALELARKVLAIEADAVSGLISRLDERFLDALGLILACRGRVVVSGVGKSGHIARKIASTLASTGTPAFFVHAAEAGHGDLGMITRDDVVLALSNSGQSDELLTIIPAARSAGSCSSMSPTSCVPATTFRPYPTPIPFPTCWQRYPGKAWACPPSSGPAKNSSEYSPTATCAGRWSANPTSARSRLPMS